MLHTKPLVLLHRHKDLQMINAQPPCMYNSVWESYGSTLSTIIHDPLVTRQLQPSCHYPTSHQRHHPGDEKRCSPQDIQVEPGMAEKRHP